MNELPKLDPNKLTEGLVEVEDILSIARGCVDCILLAANGLATAEDSHSISTVANIASAKIDDAAAMVSEMKFAAGVSGLRKGNP